MIFGMPTLLEMESLDDTMRLCKELGMEFVELNMNLPYYQVERLEETDYLRELAKRYQLFYTIHLDENLNVSDFNQGVADAYRETVCRTIEAAKEIKAPILNLHMNHGVHFTLSNGKVWLFERYRNEYMESFQVFRTMCEEAIGDADIRICIENTDGFKTYEKEAIEYLLESKVFGLTWDIGHSNASNDVDEEFIMEHHEKLDHFHIHDSLEREDHMTLGTGEINLPQRLELAKCHDCMCVVETKTIRALRESATWLKRNRYR
ncbi:MAG: sugar phosphate isomerase/epimerase [Lachnospiraceae bacterium]|nr:sugar phosphate isomerase/epimerase [Lachnospiraceae bacterium]